MKKKIRFRMLQRILILLLCTTLVSGTCLDRCKIEVHATSAAVSAEAGVEIMMALWNLVVASMVASGAGEFVANYDEEKPVFEKFMDVYGAFVGAPDNDYVTLEDGTVVSFSEFYEMYEIGTITIPDVEDWELYRDRVEEDCDDEEDYILKNWDADAIRARWEEITGGGSSGSPPEPQDEPSFHKLKSLLLSSGIVAALSATMSSLWKGEIEGVDLSQYTNINYTGIPELDENGNYIIKGYVESWENYGILYNTKWVIKQQTSSSRICGYYYFRSGTTTDPCSEFHVIQATGVFNLVCDEYLYYTTGELAKSYGNLSRSGFPYVKYNVNFPVFPNETAAKNYIETGDDTGCLNKIIDPDALASSLPAIMASKTDTQLSTSALQSMYARMKAAYQTQVKPQLETETDTDTNTQTYTDAMTQAVTETETGTDTDTETDTDEDEGTGTGTGTGTDEGEGEEETDIDIKNYALDLRQIFPFCIPFDFIALLDVLDAEPVAPRFEFPLKIPLINVDEVYIFDLSLFNDEMEMLRKAELIGFLIGLMILTGRVIKW